MNKIILLFNIKQYRKHALISILSVRFYEKEQDKQNCQKKYYARINRNSEQLILTE